MFESYTFAGKYWSQTFIMPTVLLDNNPHISICSCWKRNNTFMSYLKTHTGTKSRNVSVASRLLPSDLHYLKKVKSAENGTMTSPAYGFTIPDRAGTDPGIVCSQRNPNIPNIARRPLLISEIKPRAFASSDLSLLKPKGSYRLKGTGCGRLSKVGYFPGLPP